MQRPFRYECYLVGDRPTSFVEAHAHPKSKAEPCVEAIWNIVLAQPSFLCRSTAILNALPLHQVP